ncbi:GlcG/HbpS family heme-binding protein [Actinophytocola algeriensis]|jgi:glc operon protein GlcG|uniref:Glc operon protein GlcG n=1 Tax=Actinophytocola algeriensis TaxID=1768010 RepID=A0A7W7Q7E9_9PSEU|nr:heme-binding protein [Actinophytocola algeriensis]MBB4908435.1 glc operon protein GlcG [Actinophytocola algeriensis]MBE1475178.1 glc operon protein GlcG [Actinophytocola algeriensis]
MTISAVEARRVVDAAIAHAESLGAGVCVAVVDSGGNLKALVRMDAATFATTSLAVDKAATAAGYGMSTQALAEFASADPAVLAGLSNRPGFSLLPGALPISLGGSVVGAVGVSGSARGEDEIIAAAGLAALVEVPSSV